MDHAVAGVVEGEEGVGGRGTDGRLLAGAEHAVEEAGHYRCVKAVLKNKNN